MNPADIVVLVVVVLSAIVGLVRGFLREVLSIASWVGAGLFTWWRLEWGTGIARDLLSGMTDQPLIHQIVAGLCLFLVALIVLAVVSHYIAQLVVGGMLGAIDRSVGFVFGVARGLVLMALALIATTAMVPRPAPTTPPQPPPPPWSWIDSAQTLRFIEPVRDFLYGLAPPEYRRLVPGEQRGGAMAPALQGLGQPARVPQQREGEPGYSQGAREGLGRLIQQGTPAR